jgi:hypothetical protein
MMANVSTVVQQETESKMPLLLLWVGIPVVLLGGGYAVIHYLY